MTRLIDDLIEHAEQCDWCDADASEYQKLRQAAQLLAAVEERDRLRQAYVDIKAERDERIDEVASLKAELKLARAAREKLEGYNEWRLLREEIASLKAENERLQQMFAEIGKVLKTGGMDDPAFLAGAVQACVEIADQRGQSVRTLTEAITNVVNAYGDQGWAKSDMCRYLRKALAAVERGKGEQT